MFPFSSDSLASTTRREAIHLPDSVDIAKASQESFETHLRDTAGPASHPSPQEDRDEAPSPRDEHSAPPEEPRAPASTSAEPDSQDADSTRDDDASPAVAHEEAQETEQGEDEAGSAIVVAALVDQQPAEESLDLEANADTADADTTVASDDVDPQLEPVDLDPAIAQEVSGAAPTEGNADEASQESTLPDRLADASTVAAVDDSEPAAQSEPGRRVEGVAESTEAAEAGEESREGRSGSREPGQNETRRREVAAALPAEVDVEADTADEETSRRRGPTTESAVTQKTENVRSENGAVATNAASRFAQHVTARGHDRSEQALQISEADHRRFVDRVARALPTAEGRGGTLRLRLSPPELGALRLEVRLHNGAMTAKVEAETPMARSLLLDSLPVLRERLEEQGVRVDQFDVDLLDRRANETPDGLQHRRGQQDEQADGREASARKEDRTEEASTSTTTTPLGDEQLNVIV